MKLFSKISMRIKLALMVITLTLPILYLGFVFVKESTVEVNIKSQEIAGVEHHIYVTPLIESIAKHRSVSASYLSGDESVLQKIKTVEIEINASFDALTNFHSDYDGKIAISENLTEVKNQWEHIKNNNLDMRKRENFEKHSLLIEEINLMLEAIAYKSYLSFDNHIDMVYLTELMFTTLPVLSEELYKLRTVTTGLATRQYLEDGENSEINVLKNKVVTALSEVQKSVYGISRNNKELTELFDNNYQELSESVANYLLQTDKLLNDVTFLMTASGEEQYKEGTSALAVASNYYKISLPKMNVLLLNRAASLKSKIYLNVGITLSLFFVAFFLSVMIAREMNDNFSNIKALFKSIEGGNYNNDIEVHGNAEFAQIFSSLTSMQESLLDARDKDQRSVRINGRIKEALENATSSVVVADTHDKIIYFNIAAKKMFQSAEESIRQHVPGFKADNLLDLNISSFYQGDTSISQLSTSFKTQLEMGEKKFNVIFNPVKNDTDERIGTVMEWKDKTAELAIQDDVSSLVQAALEGDLSQRIELNDKEGFLKVLSEGVNNLVDVSERVVDDVIRVLSAMSKGDLTQKIEQEYKGAFNQLKEDANATIDTLTEVVSKIKDSSNLVNEATSEISEGNLNLSDRTEVQAGRLEETSSNMTQMTSTVQQNAQNSKQANDLAISARDQAEKGGCVVNDAVSAMREINQASNKISDIIGVIDEIAFQTNLLALNAAVEAARAGEQGRGFAVVASEVRNLAGRSATAAKEIKELIEDSVVKVDEGTRLVNQSGETLDEIMNSVKEVAEIIGDISVASQEQASGIAQVNQTIIQMDEATQQNAALVEEASASAESMSEQSDELNNLVEFFKVSKQQLTNHSSVQITPKSEGPVREERRANNRPWSDTPSVAPLNTSHVDDAVINEAGWEEF